MLFHVTVASDVAVTVDVSAAMTSTLDEMKAEGVVLSGCSCVHKPEYFLILEAGDVDEATSEIDRLSRAAAQPLSISLTEVRPA